MVSSTQTRREHVCLLYPTSIPIFIQITHFIWVIYSRLWTRDPRKPDQKKVVVRAVWIRQYLTDFPVHGFLISVKVHETHIHLEQQGRNRKWRVAFGFNEVRNQINRVWNGSDVKWLQIYSRNICVYRHFRLL